MCGSEWRVRACVVVNECVCVVCCVYWRLRGTDQVCSHKGKLGECCGFCRTPGQVDETAVTCLQNSITKNR